MNYDFVPSDIIDNFQELEDDGVNMGYKRFGNPLNKRIHILYVNFPTVEIVRKIMILIGRIPEYHLDNINFFERTQVFMSDPRESKTSSTLEERWKSFGPNEYAIEILSELIKNSGKVFPHEESKFGLKVHRGKYIKRDINQIEFYLIKNEIS